MCCHLLARVDKFWKTLTSRATRFCWQALHGHARNVAAFHNGRAMVGTSAEWGPERHGESGPLGSGVASPRPRFKACDFKGLSHTRSLWLKKAHVHKMRFTDSLVFPPLSRFNRQPLDAGDSFRRPSTDFTHLALLDPARWLAAWRVKFRVPAAWKLVGAPYARCEEHRAGSPGSPLHREQPYSAAGRHK